MGEHVHMTMHWASPKKEAMLEPNPSASPPSSRFVFPPPTDDQNEVEVASQQSASTGHEKPLENMTTSNAEPRQGSVGWVAAPAPPGSLLHKFRTYQI